MNAHVDVLSPMLRRGLSTIRNVKSERHLRCSSIIGMRRLPSARPCFSVPTSSLAVSLLLARAVNRFAILNGSSSGRFAVNVFSLEDVTASVTELVFLKVRRGESTQTFHFRMYDEAVSGNLGKRVFHVLL